MGMAEVVQELHLIAEALDALAVVGSVWIAVWIWGRVNG